MFSNKILYTFFLSTILLLVACKGGKETVKNNNPKEHTTKPKPKEPKQTGTFNGNNTGSNSNTGNKPKPPIGNNPNTNNGNNNTTNPKEGEQDTGTTVVVAPPPTYIKQTYNVAVLMPFQTEKFVGSVPNSSRTRRALAFYEGAKLALTQLSTEGVNLNVYIGDTQGKETNTRSELTKSEVTGADLILGPVLKRNTQVVADFAKQKRISMISPFNPSTGITYDNPYYIQMNPYLRTHCETITTHALQNHRPEQIVLVALDIPAERARMQYFQNKNIAMGNTTRFKEYFVKPSELNKIDMAQFVNSGAKIFIFPTWSKEPFINESLRKLMLTRKKDLRVYGMPQWESFEEVDYNFFDQLNLHISSASYIDDSKFEVKDFEKKFFEAYGIPPSLSAFRGYDVMLYAGRLLKKEGRNFQNRFLLNDAEMLHTKFSIRGDYGGFDESQPARQYENKHVNILEFENGYFQRRN